MHTRTKPLTAQEAFEQEGYICHLSLNDHRPGTVVENICPSSAVDVGTKLVVVGNLSLNETRMYCERVGWSMYSVPDGARFYKAVAE